MLLYSDIETEGLNVIRYFFGELYNEKLSTKTILASTQL